MNSDRCPSPEDWAVFAAGASSEAEWRRSVRHLAECDLCRRQAAILAMADGKALPTASLQAPPPPLPERSSRSPLRMFVRLAAAAAIVVALVTALRSMNREKSPQDPTAAAPVPPSPDRTRKPKQLPEWPEGIKPRTLPPDPAPTKREIFPPPPGLEREDPPPAPAPVATPNPAAPAPAPAPAPPPSPFLAQHAGPGVAEAIQIAPAAGTVMVETDAKTEMLSKPAYVHPSQAIRTLEGGSFTLPDGATVHLGREGEVAVSWSQTLLCYSIDLHRGGALVDLGAALRIVHVGKGDLGVRFAESSGQILLALDKDSFRAAPLTGPAEFRAPAGDATILRPRDTLVLRVDRDSIESGAFFDSRLFPTLEAPAPKPAAPPAAKPVATGPSAAELVRALPSETYRYRVNGRQIREGAWFPQGVLYSTINDFSVIKRADGTHLHARRGPGPWDNVGLVKTGTPEDRLLTILRNSKPPHEQIEISLASTRGEAQLRADFLQATPCMVSQFALDPAKLRTEVAALIDQAVLEGRMAKPDYIYWDSLDGTLEIACSKADPRVIRATDRRRVGYSYNSVAGLLRRTYVLETVYEFYDHGKASLKLPENILREMDPGQK